MFTSDTMVQNIDPILLPEGLTMTSNEEIAEFSAVRECVAKKQSSGSQQCINKKPGPRAKRKLVMPKCLETSTKSHLTALNKDPGVVQESGTFVEPNLPVDRSSVPAQKTNNSKTLSLGIEVIEFNPVNEDINKFVFKCKLCGKAIGNIFDIDFHNIRQGHFKCMFKGCNKINFPSQFELAAHVDMKHKTMYQVVPVNNESVSQTANVLPQHLALLSQSEPKQSSVVLPQNQISPVPEYRYTNNSKHVERNVTSSRTDQTSATCEEIVLIDETDEMDCNVVTLQEQIAITHPNLNIEATSVIQYTHSSTRSSNQTNSIHNMCMPAPSNTGKSLPRRGRGTRNQAITLQSQDSVFVLPESINNVTSTTRSIITHVVDRPPRLPTVDLTREMPLQSPRAIQTTPRRKSGQSPVSQNNFPCQICNKNMSTQNFLNLHMKTAHRSPNKPFRCSKCTTNYSTHEALIDHLKVFHNITPDARTMSIPVVDLNKPGSQEHLMQLGIEHFIPLSDLSADSNGNYCIPLYILKGNGEGMTTDGLRTKEVLKLGPLMTLPF